MKKFFALALALVMTLALSVTCFAALPEAENGDVKATYHAGSLSETVYSVNVEFGDMAFTYNDTVQGTWDPTTHGYTGAAAANWTANGNTVEVTNHSNAAVAVTVTYAKASGFDGITGTVTNGSFTLETAVGTTVEDAPFQTATLELSGALASSTAANTKVGTLTVTFAAAQ